MGSERAVSGDGLGCLSIYPIGDRALQALLAMEIDERYGEMRRGCYGMAAEACRIVFAMQNREKP